MITDHEYLGEVGRYCRYVLNPGSELGKALCLHPEEDHATSPQVTQKESMVTDHEYKGDRSSPHGCEWRLLVPPPQVVHWTKDVEPISVDLPEVKRCGQPPRAHRYKTNPTHEVMVAVQPLLDMANAKEDRSSSVVRKADVAQYAREPMPDAARKGITVTLIDAPVDPLGTMAVIGGIYEGRVARSKAEVTDDQRRSMLADMQKTVLNGPLESILFTFLVEGVDRAITHQMVRNRFAFYAQESLRFAVAEDWAQEIPLPPSLAGLAEDAPAVGVWRRSLNQAEDNYAALLGAGMPAEEARGVLPHAITTRLYWTVSLRTLIMEAGKRTCTQAQFPWRVLFAGVAKALRERGATYAEDYYVPSMVTSTDGWQYTAFADLLRPVCYQTGSCGFMAKFDRGCTIRSRVDANERLGRPSAEWDTQYDVVDPLEIVVGVGPKSVVVDRDGRTPVFIGAIHSREWAADPGAARVAE